MSVRACTDKAINESILDTFQASLTTCQRRGRYTLVRVRSTKAPPPLYHASVSVTKQSISSSHMRELELEIGHQISSLAVPCSHG
jgi:hypothetical protein